MRVCFLFLCAALLTLLFSGCTVIGVGIGAAVDHHHARFRHVTQQDAHTIPACSAVRITLTTDSTLNGEFSGWHTLADEKRFMVQSGERTIAVPLAHIREIFAMPKRSHYWILGGAIGLAVDAVLVTIIVQNMKEEGLVEIGAY